MPYMQAMRNDAAANPMLSLIDLATQRGFDKSIVEGFMDYPIKAILDHAAVHSLDAGALSVQNGFGVAEISNFLDRHPDMFNHMAIRPIATETEKEPTGAGVDYAMETVDEKPRYASNGIFYGNFNDNPLGVGADLTFGEDPYATESDDPDATESDDSDAAEPSHSGMWVRWWNTMRPLRGRVNTKTHNGLIREYMSKFISQRSRHPSKLLPNEQQHLRNAVGKLLKHRHNRTTPSEKLLKNKESIWRKIQDLSDAQVNDYTTVEALHVLD